MTIRVKRQVITWFYIIANKHLFTNEFLYSENSIMWQCVSVSGTFEGGQSRTNSDIWLHALHVVSFPGHSFVMSQCLLHEFMHYVYFLWVSCMPLLAPNPGDAYRFGASRPYVQSYWRYVARIECHPDGTGLVVVQAFMSLWLCWP